jgi:hypothetical protein
MGARGKWEMRGPVRCKINPLISGAPDPACCLQHEPHISHEPSVAAAPRDAAKRHYCGTGTRESQQIWGSPDKKTLFSPGPETGGNQRPGTRCTGRTGGGLSSPYSGYSYHSRTLTRRPWSSPSRWPRRPCRASASTCCSSAALFSTRTYRRRRSAAASSRPAGADRPDLSMGGDSRRGRHSRRQRRRVTALFYGVGKLSAVVMPVAPWARPRPF